MVQLLFTISTTDWCSIGLTHLFFFYLSAPSPFRPTFSFLFFFFFFFFLTCFRRCGDERDAASVDANQTRTPSGRAARAARPHRLGAAAAPVPGRAGVALQRRRESSASLRFPFYFRFFCSMETKKNETKQNKLHHRIRVTGLG